MAKSGERLSDVEQHALLAVWRLGDGAHGADVRDELARTIGRRLSISAVYVTLVRMEERGLVTSRLSEPVAVRGGKAKRLFAITDEGMEGLRAAREQLDRLWQGLEVTPK